MLFNIQLWTWTKAIMTVAHSQATSFRLRQPKQLKLLPQSFEVWCTVESYVQIQHKQGCIWHRFMYAYTFDKDWHENLQVIRRPVHAYCFVEKNFIVAVLNFSACIWKYGRKKRIHSWSGLSIKLECSTFPALSTIAEVVMDDSMHNIAVIASNRVTSFLNISLACAINIDNFESEWKINIRCWKCTEYLPCARRIKLSSIRTVVLAVTVF